MPEGDALHRAAERLRVLEGEVVAAESPHPRAAVLGIAERIDGKRLERVEAHGKNLLLTFEGGLVVRSHLRMHGRWFVQPVGRPVLGSPWLVLRSGEWQAVQRNGPVLELGKRNIARLGPDVMADSPDIDGMLVRFRGSDQSREVGEALLDQHLVAGIGNKWKAEVLFATSLSPWLRLRELSDERLREVLQTASQLMRTPRRGNLVYRRAGLPCRRCGARIASRPQGENARVAYWCPSCQAGTEAVGA
ncbi:MAG TPA: DNA-formamidopyrimidine glycosylase family protein [Gaiellaceae bacterium]|nr:DNA-formamidopyrimidine glycosylase family protein [Gaiellaceae bacterium]